MTCPSCNYQGLDPNATFCDQCGWNFESDENQQQPILGSVVRPEQTGSAVIGITVDRTDSSKRFQKGCKKVIEDTFNGFKINNVSPSIFLFSHGDLDEGQDTIMHTVNGSPQQVILDFNSIQFGGGGFPKENHLDAIEHLKNNVPWNPLAHNAIISIMNDESKPLRSGKEVENLGQELKSQNIKLFLICEITPILYKLSKSAGGIMIPISNSPNPDEIQIIVQQLTASIQASLGSGNTVPLNENNPNNL
ncbi:MAG: hypothetical protein DRP35_04820 [Candidatus Zixiibacteriota bacterium]|nr:MAG: hypothetical protein DRP35_04820 [candidate division Zixibacteria bacterium]